MSLSNQIWIVTEPKNTPPLTPDCTLIVVVFNFGSPTKGGFHTYDVPSIMIEFTCV